MDVVTVFIVEVCLALLLSRTLVAHLRAFMRRAGNALRDPCSPRAAAHRRQAAAPTIPEAHVANQHRRSP